MRVFLAGATGVIGRRLLPRLRGAGHEVTAMTRRADRADELREAGAAAAVCDVFDPEGVRAAMERARPEVVVHAAAWTDFDGCARDPDLALRRNGAATGVLAAPARVGPVQESRASSAPERNRALGIAHP